MTAEMAEMADLRMVVTGGGAGIGRATALLAARRGAQVSVLDRDGDRADAVAMEIGEAGGRASAIRCDVADETSVRAAIERSAGAMGGIDVLHCNAGITDAIASPDASVDGLSLTAWDAVFAVNVRGVLVGVQAALPHLRASTRAAVVTAASIAASHARPRTLAYASSKAALVQLTRSLALELAPDRIRVNAYSPGMVRTEMAQRYLAASDDPRALLDRVLENYLTDDIADPEDVAEVACFLASERSRFVNGAVVDVDGGFAAFKATADERRVPSAGEGARG